MSKILLIAAAGAGYVLGTKAGRQRYEQIKSVANKTRTSPAVRGAASQAQSVVRDRVASRIPFGSNNGRVPAYSQDAAPDADFKPHHV
ncbi:MAG: hypothetical protein ACRDO7_02655 [Nocardioidaceae bacterium]